MSILWVGILFAAVIIGLTAATALYDAVHAWGVRRGLWRRA